MNEIIKENVFIFHEVDFNHLTFPVFRVNTFDRLYLYEKKDFLLTSKLKNIYLEGLGVACPSDNCDQTWYVIINKHLQVEPNSVLYTNLPLQTRECWNSQVFTYLYTNCYSQLHTRYYSQLIMFSDLRTITNIRSVYFHFL